jgi:hypothetical protein
MVRSPVATYVGLLYDVAKLVDLDLMLLDRLLNNGELALGHALESDCSAGSIRCSLDRASDTGFRKVRSSSTT